MSFFLRGSFALTFTSLSPNLGLFENATRGFPIPNWYKSKFLGEQVFNSDLELASGGDNVNSLISKRDIKEVLKKCPVWVKELIDSLEIDFLGEVFQEHHLSEDIEGRELIFGGGRSITPRF